MDNLNRCKHHKQQQGNAEFGIALIILGIVFLCLKLNWLQFELQWYLVVSALFFAMGIAQLVQITKPHKIFEGLSKIIMGFWFYAAFSGLWGLNPANSWPILIIAAGASIVFKSMFCSSRTAPDNDSKNNIHNDNHS